MSAGAAAHRVGDRLDAHARRAGRPHDERTAVTVPTEDQEQVGVPRAGHPDLLAIDDDVAAAGGDRGLRGREVTAGPGLPEPDRRELPAGQVGQVPAALVAMAEPLYRPR